MGICVLQLNTKFFIERQHERAVLEAIQSLDPFRSEKAVGVRGELHFAFVDTTEYKEAKDIFEAFHAWRWLLDTDDDGNINHIEFLGEKLGNDTVLFEAIAPFIRSGSYIEMARDDGIVWRWLFRNGTVYAQTGKIVYEEPTAP